MQYIHVPASRYYKLPNSGARHESDSLQKIKVNQGPSPGPRKLSIFPWGGTTKLHAGFLGTAASETPIGVGIMNRGWDRLILLGL